MDHEEKCLAAYLQKTIVLAIGCVFASATLTFAADTKTRQDKDAAAELSAQDKRFMTKAAQAGHAEIATGKLAASKSLNDDIKEFGQQMVDDHSKTNDELGLLARTKGFALPSEPDAAHKQLAKRLEGLKDAEFDRLYLSEAGFNDHRAAMNLFTSQAKLGKDKEIKAFAEKTLPTIKHHHQMAEDLLRTTTPKKAPPLQPQKDILAPTPAKNPEKPPLPKPQPSGK